MDLRPIQDLKTWYDTLVMEAFPENERKPLSDIEALVSSGTYEVLGLWEGSRLLGFASLWSHPDHPGYVLLDYLAVAAERRNGGLGERILRLLGDRLAGRAVLITEAEAPVPGDGAAENALRARRIGFYRRCGFREVYDTAACGARFRALVLGEVPGDLSMLMEAHRAIYGPKRTDVKLPLGPEERPELPYWMK